MEITGSARKHGIADEDMIHAVEHALVSVDQDDYRVLFIGPAVDGKLLEVVVVTDQPPAIIHAMHLRPAFYRFL